MRERLFTPATARETLRRVRATAEKIYRLYQELEFRRPSGVEGDQRVDPLYFAMLQKLGEGLSRLGGEGLQVDDLKQGMIDFPALRDGRLVLLCWRVGEPSLCFWHEIDSGFERLRVDEDGPWNDWLDRP